MPTERIPSQVTEAPKDPRWQAAMMEEMHATRMKLGTVDLPECKRAVGCKWVYTLKYISVRIVQRYKVRLVAKSLIHMVWTTLILSPATKLSSISLILLAANLYWPSFQMDVKNAFLHGDLQEVYSVLPSGISL